MDKRTARFIGLALAESARSTYNRVKIGAVITRGSYLISKGANLNTSHPLQYLYNTKVGRKAPAHNLHAEMHAVVKARRMGVNLNGAEIYVGRYSKAGALAMCRPCSACYESLLVEGVSRIIYTTPAGIRSEVIK